jgi:hypothetical protein
MTSLAHLNLSGNRLASVPESLGNLTALEYLYLSGNQLESIPKSLSSLLRLRRLDLRHNRLRLMPEWTGKLTALTQLDLAANRLERMPESLGNLSCLTRLDLHGNRLASVPESLGKLTALTELNLSGNQLESIPESVGNLTRLTRLDLRGNRLLRVPESLGSLNALTGLDLRGNRLAQLPESLCKLTALTSLRLDRNQLTGLPIRLADLLADGLELGLDGNPLADPLPELARRGSAELATYLCSLYDAEPQYEAKLLMVGEGNVGKSSLVAALRPAPFVEGRPTTHGIEITPLTFQDSVAGKDITLRGWDFGGQEVYRITHQFLLYPPGLVRGGVECPSGPGTGRGRRLAAAHPAADRPGRPRHAGGDSLRRAAPRTGLPASAAVLPWHAGRLL